MNDSNEVLEYLNNLPKEEQRILGAIRKYVFVLVPDIEEKLSSGVPFFYYRGKRAVGLRSSKNHLSFFIMEGNVVKDQRNELTDFDNSSTVIRFTAEKLIQKLVLARIAEIDQTLSKKYGNDKQKTRTTTR